MYDTKLTTLKMLEDEDVMVSWVSSMSFLLGVVEPTESDPFPVAETLSGELEVLKVIDIDGQVEGMGGGGHKLPRLAEAGAKTYKPLSPSTLLHLLSSNAASGKRSKLIGLLQS